MKRKLNTYLGRMVRLDERVFEAKRYRAASLGYDLENCFLVSERSSSLDYLICYGANIRVVVNAANVVLV